MALSFISDSESWFDVLCSIFEDRLSEDNISGFIEYKEEDSPTSFFVLNSDGIKTYIYDIVREERSEFIFISRFAFYEDIDCSEMVENIKKLVGRSLQNMAYRERSENPERLFVYEVNVTGDYVRDHSESSYKFSYDITIEFKPEPSRFTMVSMMHNLFELWISFQNFAFDFQEEIMYQNSLLDEDEKVITTDRNFARLAKK